MDETLREIVCAIKRKSSFVLSPFGQKFSSDLRVNYLNRLHRIDYGGRAYVIKAPKALSGLLCSARIWAFRRLGDSALTFASCRERFENERYKFRALAECGLGSPVVDVGLLDVIVREYIEGENCKAYYRRRDISLTEKFAVLSLSANGLEAIHRFFPHGDAQVKNTIVTSNRKVFWFDFEYLLNPGLDTAFQKARDILLLLFSAAGAIGEPEGCTEAVLGTYSDASVKARIPSVTSVQSDFYNLLMHLLPVDIARRTRAAISKNLQGIC